jgi:two-component system response regulator FixJ
MVTHLGYLLESFSSGAALWEACRRSRDGGCVLAAAELPDLNAVTLLEWIRVSSAPLAVLVHTRSCRAAEVVQLLKAGAVSVLDWPLSEDELQPALEEALQAAERAACLLKLKLELEAHLSELRPVQRRVLQLLASGYANQRMAFELGLGLRTVEAHRKHVMATMRAESLSQLIHFYLFACELGNEIDSEGMIRKEPNGMGMAVPRFSRLADRVRMWNQATCESP